LGGIPTHSRRYRPHPLGLSQPLINLQFVLVLRPGTFKPWIVKQKLDRITVPRPWFTGE
jgi:hypothetical protein